jgi:type IV pilus assembly protein PilM
MIRLHRTHLQPIGLDLGSAHVRMLQLEEVGGELSVAAAATEPVPPEVSADPHDRVAALEPLLRRMLRRGHFRGRRVVAMLPRHIVQVKNLRLPPMPAGELESAVRLESPSLFGCDADQARLHYLPTGEVRQGSETRQELIAVAARTQEVDEYVQQLHHCGLIVESIDFEPCALFRGIERFIRRKEDQSEVQVLVDIGASRSCVVIARGRDITFYKSIDIGGKQFNEAVAAKLGISMEETSALRRRLAEAPQTPLRSDPVLQAVYDAVRGPVEELGREISLCLRYYSVTFRGQRPGRMRLMGGEACDVRLQKLLSGSVAIPVETGRPLYSINTSRMDPSERRGTMSQWAIALGLSLRLTSGTFRPRDGKPRDPNAPRDDLAAADDEMNLMDEIIQSTPLDDAPSEILPAEPVPAAPLEREVVHA